MKTASFFIFALTLITLGVGCSKNPSESGQSSLSGVVTFEDQTDHSGIAVRLQELALQTTTSASGAYSFSAIPAGTYSLLACDGDTLRHLYDYTTLQGVSIAPIDSEHSALWQCLRAGETREVRRLILTASGGPFRERPLATFSAITPDEALAHPTWKMGPRITIDSATMMNKGFEIIEAARLFGFPSENIDVVIHPQSVIHSMVEFQDGSVVAQLGPTDMTHPITYALFAPERLMAAPDAPTLDFARIASLDFAPPDTERYPALKLARRALATGRTAPAVLNAADEAAVGAFLDGHIRFPEIASLVDDALTAHIVASDAGIGDIIEADRWARDFVAARVQREIAPQR